MTVIIFIIVLAVLVFVHELGHFVAAKIFGIRVDEFAIGFPPRIFSWTKGETKYSINLIPFGGFVKIHGENYEEDKGEKSEPERSFAMAAKWKQVIVLSSGVLMNVFLAWILLSFSFMSGSLRSLGDTDSLKYEKNVVEKMVVVVNVLQDSPAQKGGLRFGDRIVSIKTKTSDYGTTSSPLTVASIKEIVGSGDGSEIKMTISRAGKLEDLLLSPKKLKPEDSRYAVGIYMDNIGVVKFGFFSSWYESFKLTMVSVKDISVGMAVFLKNAFTLRADFSQVSGPVGMANMVGQAADISLSYFFSFIAFISLNLAVLNFIPFPALDGGRIVFVIIEAIFRIKIKDTVVNVINGLGFILLIALMVFVTYKDIIKLF